MLGNILSRIDLLGIPILLNFSKSKKVRTNFGGFWTLAFLAFVIWAIYNSGSELFEKKKPQVNQGVIYNPKVRPVEFSSKSLPVAITALEADYYDISVDCTYSYILHNDSSADTSSGWLEMEKCTKEHFAEFDGIIDDDTQDILDYYYCIPTKASDYGMIYSFTLAVYCSEQDGLEDFLGNNPTVDLYYPKYGLSLQDYKSPIKPYLFDYSIRMEYGATHTSWSLNHLNITTDAGWLATSDKTDYYVQVAPKVNPPVIENEDGNGAQVVFHFDIDKEELFYTRTYTKVQNVLADVGGIAGSVLGVMLILITPYTRIKLSEAFVNEMFQIKLEKQQQVQEEKQRKVKSKKVTKEMKNSQRGSKESIDGKETKKDSLKALELSKRDNKGAASANVSVVAKEKPEPAEFVKTENDESPYKSPLACEDERPLVSGNERIYVQASQLGETLAPQVNPDTPKSVKRSDSDVEEGLKSIQTVRQKELTDRLETKNPFLGNQNENDNEIIIDVREDRNGETHKDLETLEVGSARQIAEVEAAVEGDDEGGDEERISIRDGGDIQAQAQKSHDRDPNEVALKNGNIKSSPTGVFGALQIALPSKPMIIKRPNILHISFLEYVKSFFFKSEVTKEKLAILNKGIDLLDSRLDIVSILKKLRDVDKIKGMIFDTDQQFLFDKLPRPEINNRANHWFQEDYAPYYEVFKDSNEFEELGIKAQIRDSKKRIEDKPKKSKIDEKILRLM